MALRDLTIMLPTRLGCPLSLKTPYMRSPGYKERGEEARPRRDVVVAEAIGTAVLSIATNPYGRYIWSKGRGGAGSAVRRV